MNGTQILASLIESHFTLLLYLVMKLCYLKDGIIFFIEIIKMEGKELIVLVFLDTNNSFLQTNCQCWQNVPYFVYCSLFLISLTLTWKENSLTRIPQTLAKAEHLMKCWICHPKPLSVHDHTDPLNMSVTNFSAVPDFTLCMIEILLV